VCACVFVFGSGNTNRPEMIYRDFSALISLFLKIIPQQPSQKTEKEKSTHWGFIIFSYPLCYSNCFHPQPLTHTRKKQTVTVLKNTESITLPLINCDPWVKKT
jgi:hypothetical protein